MKRQTKREYLRGLVADKNAWNRPLTDEEQALGFLGWHERGYLPHCDYPDLVQFVTIRLEDSMPILRRSEWEHLLKIEDSREKRTKLEEYLDKGVGSCELRHPEVAGLVEQALLYRHEISYKLLAWCVMPNHVHVLVHVLQIPLWQLLKSWKQFISRNTGLERRFPNRSGFTNPNTPTRKSALRPFWQREYWDTFMRNEEQTRKAIHYIESNPVKAGLCRTAADWPFSSARHRDKFHRLKSPEVTV